MATKVAKRPIRHRAAVRKAKARPSPAAAISAAYEHAENFVEAQRDLLRGMIESLTDQIARHAPKRPTAAKASRAHHAPRKRAATRRPAKRAA